MAKFYVTTTLPYVNAPPHMGHALEFIQADAIARYKRSILGDENVIFNIGLDEHGLKIYEKALESGIAPQEFVDRYAKEWGEFCKLYSITNTNFYRTSSSRHEKLAKKMWHILQEKGQLYKKKYKGLYCVGCESFKTEKDLIEGKCPDHGKEPIVMEEENYFLRLSDHTKKLVEYIKSNPEFVKNSKKLNHLNNFLAGGLQDISVSRSKDKLPWGIDIPDDPDQVMYVWLDALSNYIFTVGYLQNKDEFEAYWPGIQLCGTDNLKFQAAIWQGILAALDLPFSKQILVHGMINAEDGTKMSKTIGNVISPVDILQEYGLEPVRYYMLFGVPTYDDTSFSHERLVELYNDGLADKYGNLLNRVIHLANQHNIKLFDSPTYDEEFKKKVDDRMKTYTHLMGQFELSSAFAEIYALSMEGNEYITVKEPWVKGKSMEEVKLTLQSVAYLLTKVIEGYSPILVNTTKIAQNALLNQEKIILFEKIK